MADLRSLMQIAPSTAAYFTGQEFADSRQKEQLEQQKLAQTIQDLKASAEQAKQMNPLLLEQQRLRNQISQAELPGVVADSTLKGINADIAGQTKETKVEEAKTKLDADRAKLFDTRSKQFMELAPILEAIPTHLGQRSAAAIQMLGQIGLDVNSPQAKVLLQSPETMPAVMKKIAQRMAEQSSAYIQAMDVANFNKGVQKDIAAGNNATQLQVARINADSRLQAAAARSQKKASDIISQVQSGKLTFEKAATAFEVMASLEEDGEKKQAYFDMAKKFEEANLKAKNAAAQGKPDVAGMGIPTQTITPALGGGAKPKQGTKENPIVLK